MVPPAWLVAGNIAVQGSYGSYGVTMIDKGECCLTEHGDAVPPPLYPGLATATLAADEQAVIVIGAGSIKEFHATVRPWTDETALYSGAERELKAEAEPAGNATAFVLEPTGKAGDLLLLVSITFPVDFDPNYPVNNSASYLWRLNPGTEPVAQPASLPARAVYLVQNPGQLSLDDLQTHPEVAVTNSFDDLKQLAQTKVALWIDKDAVSQVDNQWLHDMPQKYYPLVLVGYSNALCAFRETLTGFGIEGPPADCSVQSPGFSVWMLREETSSSLSAFMQGYDQAPTVQAILDITNALLAGKTNP